MNRITFKDAAGRWVIACNRFWNWIENNLPGHLRGEAVDRLAAYENTGLEPEEVEIQSTAMSQCKPYIDAICDAQGKVLVNPDRLHVLVTADLEKRCLVSKEPLHPIDVIRAYDILNLERERNMAYDCILQVEQDPKNAIEHIQKWREKTGLQ